MPPTASIVDLNNSLKGFVEIPVEESSSTYPDPSSPLKEILERSPDKGAFLLSQPVPRCGAFCYLAVVSRNPKK